MVRAYERDSTGQFTDVTYINDSCKFGAGGFICNAGDLVKLGMAFSSGKLISAGMVKLALEGDVNKENIYLTGGVSTGGRSVMGINIKTGDCIVIPGSQREESLENILKQLFSLLQ